MKHTLCAVRPVFGGIGERLGYQATCGCGETIDADTRRAAYEALAGHVVAGFLADLDAEPPKMSAAEAVAALDRLSGESPGDAHQRADEILMAAAPAEVREAYLRLSGDRDRDGRADWWAWA